MDSLIFYIFLAFLGLASFTLGFEKDLSERGYEHKRHVAKAIGTLLLIGLFAALMLGTSSDCSENDDPLRGSCSTSQEYTPTSEQRTDSFIRVIAILGVPYFVGYYANKSSGHSLRKAEEKRLADEKFNKEFNEWWRKEQKKDNKAPKDV